MKIEPSKIPAGSRIIFKAIVGSRAFGTNIKGSSDTDIKGVYIQHPDDIYGFAYQPHAVVGKDETYYEIHRFIELLKDGNPSCLELLFSPDNCILINDSSFKRLMDVKNIFVTKKCIFTFANYAMQQFGKAEIHNRHRRNKNLLHCRRLLDMAMEIAKKGQIKVKRRNRKALLSIKNGSTSFKDVQKSAQEDFEKLKEIAKTSKLPTTVDELFVHNLLVKIRTYTMFGFKNDINVAV